jgi:Tol biopolymer transport system component
VRATAALTPRMLRAARAFRRVAKYLFAFGALAALVALLATDANGTSARAHGPVFMNGTRVDSVRKSPPGLYAFDASTQALKQLLPGADEREDVEWSPDGRWIASTDTADFLVDVIQPDGQALQDVISVLWSPRGSTVAHTTDDGLFVGSSIQGGGTLVAEALGGAAIDWARDGSEFIFGTGRPGSCCWPSIGVSRADGTGARVLWAPPATGGHDSWIDNAAFSPDGRRIALGATINNAVAKDGGGNFVYVTTPGESGVTQLTNQFPGAELLAWSGDGKWLVLSSGDALFRVDPRGGPVEPLCRSCNSGTLSPDRQRIAYMTRNAGTKSWMTLWVSSIDGKTHQRVIKLRKSSYFVWSPDSLSLGLTLAGPRRQQSSIAVVDLATRKLRRLTDGSKADFVAELSRTGGLVAYFRDNPPSLWVKGINGGAAHKVMTLASGPLGPCPLIAWSPTAPMLAIANEACAPS